MTTEIQGTPRAPQRTKVRDMSRSGLSPREIAGALGISTQRVYQHLTRLRALGELPRSESAA